MKNELKLRLKETPLNTACCVATGEGGVEHEEIEPKREARAAANHTETKAAARFAVWIHAPWIP